MLPKVIGTKSMLVFGLFFEVLVWWLAKRDLIDSYLKHAFKHSSKVEKDLEDLTFNSVLL